MSKLTETLKAAGWVETTLGECRLGEEVLLTQAYFIPRGVRVTKTKDRAGYVRTSDGDAWIHDVTVLRAPRPEYAPGTYAKVECGDVVTTGVLFHGGKCAVTATATIVPLSDVKVLETIWEPGEGDADLVRASVAPSLAALKASPGWCVIDADGDWWRWEAGELLIRERRVDDFYPWWTGEEAADKYISHKDARWALAPKDEEE